MSGTPEPENSIEEDIAEDHSENNSFFFHEEKHLELFYIASFLLLSFLVFHILKRNMETSRKRSKILQELKTLRKDTGETVGVLRQISLH